MSVQEQKMTQEMAKYIMETIIPRVPTIFTNWKDVFTDKQLYYKKKRKGISSKGIGGNSVKNIKLIVKLKKQE